MNKQSMNQTKATAVPHINVTPLIDVLLVLLIIFMVISPLRPSRFKAMISEPPIEDDGHHISPRTLIVDVGRDARIRLIKANETVAEGSLGDSSAVSFELAREFAERKARRTWKLGMENRAELAADERIERTVFLRAPRTLGYGEVARVIDGIKGAGASPVGLQIDELID